MRVDFFLTIALAGLVAAKAKKTSKGGGTPSRPTSRVEAPPPASKSSQVVVSSPPKTAIPSPSTVSVPLTSKVIASSPSAVSASSAKSSSVIVTLSSVSSISTVPVTSVSVTSAPISSFTSSVPSSSSSALSSSATGKCFYKGYTPKIDPGPEEDIEKRSVAGRSFIEKRAARAPTEFGFGCGTMVNKIGGSGLTLHENPNKVGVLKNTNGAGNIPKWFRLKEACNAAPGLEIISDTDPDQKTEVVITGLTSTRKMNKYNVDHVWELKLMDKFFKSLLPEENSATSTLTCDDFDKAFIDPRGKAAPKEDHPIQQLYALMPQKLQAPTAKPDTLEFAGTSIQLNGKKGRILTPKGEGSSLSGSGHMNTLKTTKDRIEALRAVGTTIEFMNHREIKPLFDRAQVRLKDYLAIVDSRIADPANGITLSKSFIWADEFEAFIKKYLKDREDDTWDWVKSMLAQVEREVAAMPKQTPEQQAEKTDHEEWLRIFENSPYSKEAHYKIDWTA